LGKMFDSVNLFKPNSICSLKLLVNFHARFR
jgi:hypothetical protein